jgi:tRNA(Arg) A34 adenosine deaminase TadA
MYASGEPCPMCLTAMYFAGIDKVYYCQSVDDAFHAGLDKSKMIYEDLKNARDDRGLKLVQMPLQEDQDNPMKLWKENV